MNAKKHGRNRRRPHRVSVLAKANMQAKSNIGAKRVTLYPGFLMNGFASGTAKKLRGSNSHIKTKDHLLTENLQAFLDQKSNLRRSQRIINKRSSVVEEDSISSNPTVPSLKTSPIIAEIPNNKPYKPILKNNSKSIFKDINEIYFNKIKQNPIEPETYNNNRQTQYLTDEEVEEISNNEIELDIQRTSSPEIKQTNLTINNKFIENFTRKMRVFFKRDALKECQQNISSEILNANLILEGKLKRRECAPDKNNSGQHSSEDNNINDNIIPLPPNRWVYHTPKNQKIKSVEIEESQIQPAIFCNNQLFEVKPNNRFVRKISGLFKSPEPRTTQMELSPIIEFPFAQPKSRRLETKYMATPEHSAEDFTFILDGNDMRIQQSQSTTHYKEQDEFRGNNSSNFNLETKPMFDFCSQGTKMFDFGV